MVVVFLIVMGLAFGSFVNALVWRLYQQSLPKKKRAASDKELSISTGRSMCTHCKHTLTWYDLLPIVSWLSVGGKCRYCRKPIGIQYPLVELATTAVFVWSYVAWPFALSGVLSWMIFVVWLVAVVMFMALLVYDSRWMLLPNRLVFPLTGLGVLSVLLRILQNPSGWLSELLSSIGGLAVAGGIFYVIFQISAGNWIGGGDVKMGFAIGLLLGSPLLGFLMLFIASLIGIIVMLPGIISGRKRLKSTLPFGPFLIISTFIAILHGQALIDWYMNGLLYL